MATEGTCCCCLTGSGDEDHQERLRRYQEIIDETIKQHGWFVQMVAGSEDSPPFAYTIGLTESLGHPELIMVAIDPEAAAYIFSAIYPRLTENDEFLQSGQSRSLIPGIFGRGCLASIVKVERDKRDEYMGMARNRYGLDGFEAIQLVVPDVNGRYPWHPDCDTQQVLLG